MTEKQGFQWKALVMSVLVRNSKCVEITATCAHLAYVQI